MTTLLSSLGWCSSGKCLQSQYVRDRICGNNLLVVPDCAAFRGLDRSRSSVVLQFKPSSLGGMSEASSGVMRTAFEPVAVQGQLEIASV
jgi:hypothetical protein